MRRHWAPFVIGVLVATSLFLGRSALQVVETSVPARGQDRPGGGGVRREHLNPEALFPSLGYGFSQVVTTRGGTTIHASGQVAWDADKRIVGEGDLRAQAAQALKNVGAALDAAGASPADVVRMRIYVVDLKPKDVAVIGEATRAFFPEAAPPASTLIGVAALSVPDFLIEIEVTAVVD